MDTNPWPILRGSPCGASAPQGSHLRMTTGVRCYSRANHSCGGSARGLSGAAGGKALAGCPAEASRSMITASACSTSGSSILNSAFTKRSWRRVRAVSSSGNGSDGSDGFVMDVRYPKWKQVKERLRNPSSSFAANQPVILCGEIQDLAGACRRLQHAQQCIGRAEMRDADGGDALAQR